MRRIKGFNSLTGNIDVLIRLGMLIPVPYILVHVNGRLTSKANMSVLQHLMVKTFLVVLK